MPKEAIRSGNAVRLANGVSIAKILMVGLIFTLIDVIYFVWLVEKQDADTAIPSLSTPSEPSFTTSNELESKEEIFEILRGAGVNPDLDLDAETVAALPSWPEVVRLYGEEPVIYGLDRCEDFQMATMDMGLVSTAGTFNSGTNLMAELLIANCHMQKRMDKFGVKNRGVRWQVPWGKHTPMGDESIRHDHKTKHDGDIDADEILPAVTIRDPITWLGSMCRHKYTARWNHPDKNRCPDFSLPDLSTTVKYKAIIDHHDSILHMWNDFYTGYLNVEFPRLIVRFEDLLFHPKKVTETVCHCAGGNMRKDGKFLYIVDSAKKGEHAHGKMTERTGLVGAMIKYGTEKEHYSNFHFASDVDYVKENADPTLMELMNYPIPDSGKLSPRNS